MYNKSSNYKQTGTSKKYFTPQTNTKLKTRSPVKQISIRSIFSRAPPVLLPNTLIYNPACVIYVFARFYCSKRKDRICSQALIYSLIKTTAREFSLFHQNFLSVKNSTHKFFNILQYPTARDGRF